MSFHDTSIASTSANFASSPSNKHNTLIAQFVAECGRRNIAPPTSVVQALQNTVSNGGVFELQDCMLGEQAVASLCHALTYCFGAIPTQYRQHGKNRPRSEEGDEHSEGDRDNDEFYENAAAGDDDLSLRQLSLRNAYIGDQGCVTILRFLIKNAVNSLEVLELPGNSISESCGEIATAVAVLTKLKKINLDWNKIGANSAFSSTSSSSSSSASLRSKSEESVNVAMNNINNSNNNNINNPSSANAVHRLLNALSTHHSIEQVSLQNNLLGRASVDDVCHLVATCRTLEHLDVSWNSLGENGGVRIANAVNRSPSSKLTTVEVQGNSFARKDCESIERKLRVNREIGAKAEAAQQQEDQLRVSIEKLQREVLDLRGQLTETRAKYSAQEMLLAASRQAEESAKTDREKYEHLMGEAQEALRAERTTFQRKLDDEHTRCSEAIEQSSRRLREACEAADDAQSKARIQRAEMEAEVAAARDKRHAAEKEASTATATSQAALIAMERIQGEHSVVARSLTESRQRVAELEVQLKVRTDETDRLRAAASTASVDLEAAKSAMRQSQENCEQLRVRVKDLEYTVEQTEKRRSDDLRSALLRTESEQSEATAAAQRQVRQAEQDKLATEKMMIELKVQFENARRQFEAAATEANVHSDRLRDKCSEMELETEKLSSKLSLLEIEAGRSDSRAKSADERAKLLQLELQQSLHQHKNRIEELAREFERKLSDKESELQERQREARVHGEEIALLKAKNDALSAKMRQQQVDLEKRVVKSLRSAMHDVQYHHHQHRGGGSGGDGVVPVGSRRQQQQQQGRSDNEEEHSGPTGDSD